jgi:hypothetical protein
MQIGDILVGICIGVIATAIFEFICSGMSRVVEQILISPLREFWKPFLREGGIIVIPPYPKNRSGFSVKHATGYNDCIASGEIRKFLALMGKDIEVKEEISDTDRKNNLVVIGGPMSNPTFKEVITQVKPPIVFVDHDIYIDDEKFSRNEDLFGWGLLYLCKGIWSENRTIILIAGCGGRDTKKFAEILTTKKYIKLINRRWKERNYVSTVFILKYGKIGDTSPKDIVEICRDFQIV